MHEYASYGDEMLMTLIASGDTLAFRELYLRHKKELWLVVFNATRSKEQAEDLVQEVFVSLWQRRAEVNIIVPKAWLLQATRFQVLKAYRQQKADAEFLSRFKEVSEQAEASGPVALDEIPRLSKVVLTRLPKDQQEILRLRGEEGLTNKEIAEEMGISVKTVEKKMTLILKYIRGGFDKALLFIFI